MTTVGTIREIWRCPVKSMRGERIDAGTFTATGLEGDRRWGVFDVDTGKVLSAKRHGRLLDAGARLPADGGPPVIALPDGRELVAGDPALDETLTGWLDRPVAVRPAAPDGGTPWEFWMDELYPADMEADGVEQQLVELDTPAGSLYDLGTVHLLTTAALAAAAAEHPDGAWDVQRFRPQFVVDTGEMSGFVENGWAGAHIAAGEAALRGVMPTVRCVMTTRSQDELPRDLDIWRTVKRSNAFNLGLYADVESPGRLRVGDEVAVTPS